MCKSGNKKNKSKLSPFICVFIFLLLALLIDTLGGSEVPQVAIEPKLVETKSSKEDLFSLSLEQLMDVGVYAAATLTEKDPLKTPASVTTITARDIALTPARNIYDLIEIYVPGALYLNHSVGPVLGMRGFIADRPYKFLVNVNGMNVNIKAHYGARLELLNWELSDIDRIEIVRGPGSVTYGPGAIGGVINIYTKKGKQAPGWEIGGHYWSKYDSIGNYVSYGRSKDQFDLYGYFSIVNTHGVRPDMYGVINTTGSTKKYGYGYIQGEGGGPMGYDQPISYMGDYYDDPQIKAHIDIRFNDEWRFWARYVTSSYMLIRPDVAKCLIDGDSEDLRGGRHRYFQFVLENNRTLSKDFNLKSTFGISSIDTVHLEYIPYSPLYYTTSTFNSDWHSLQNIKWIWSEWEYFARFMLNYQPEDKNIKAAIGYEISWDSIRPAWGKSKGQGLRMGDGGIISGPESGAYGSGSNQINDTSATGIYSKYFPAGNGWDTVMHSFLSELNLTVTPKTTMIFSARVDKHSFTGYMLSPRFALIQELRKDEYLKFIMQRSVRMNTAEELYMNHKLTAVGTGASVGKENIPETLQTFELIYSRKFNECWSTQASAFLNKNDALAWDSTLRGAAPIGRLRTFGVELELLYRKENFELGINHSYVKQLSFELADGVQKSGISYSDYYRDNSPTGNSATDIHSYGNNLNNWSNHATKFFTNVDMFNKKVTLHADLVTLWGFEGAKEGLAACYQAGYNSGAIEDIRNKKAFSLETRANLSLTYHLNKLADVTMFVQNISVIGENKRYDYNSGQANYPYPDKIGWIEEPMVVGVRYKVRF